MKVNPVQTTTLNEVICTGETYTVGTSTYSATGIYVDTLQTYQSCDSIITLNLKVNPVQATTLNQVICAGETYTVGTSTYSATGIYVDTLSTYQSCDSIITLNLLVNPVQTTTLNEVICAGENYTVGTSTYSVTGTYVDTLSTYQSCDSIITLNLLVNPVQTTTLNEVICAGENYTVGTSTYSVTGTYVDTLQTYQNCDSIITLNLKVNPVQTTTLNQVICAGETYTVGTSNYSATGTYVDTLQTYQSCDSIITLNLKVNPVQTTTLNEVICAGENYTVGTSTYSVTGTYVDTLQTYQSCDSIITLNLKVNPVQTTTLNQVICAGENYTVGTSTYSATGTYVDTLSTYQSCDSIITLNLKVNPVQTTTLNEVICAGENYTVGTSTYSVTGTYVDTLPTYQNCDSIITLNLKVNPVQTTTLNEVICAGETYTVGTSTYSATGIYVDTLPTYQNCDSIITLNLKVNPVQTTTLNEVICTGETYTVGTSTYSATGTYVDTLETYQSCDSIITLNLLVNPVQTTTLNEVICAGETYTVGTSTYSATGIYVDTLSTYQSCDSIITLNLLVNPVQTTTLNEVICAGENYTVGTSTCSVTGTYVDTLSTYQSCDSIITLNLKVNPVQTTTLNEVICAGETYTVGTSTYSATGIYVDTLQTYQSCDSIITLNLKVNPVQATTLNQVICAGETYTVGTSTYSVTGTYVDTLETYQNCDSIITLNLLVNPVQTTTLNEVICAGETYTVGTSTYSATGIYVDTLSTYQSCDSIITLNLLVNPVQTTTLNEVICAGENYTVWYFNLLSDRHLC